MKIANAFLIGSKVAGAASGVSMATNITGSSYDVSNLSDLAIDSIWTGTPTGTIKLQASNNGTDWIDVPSMTASPAGAAGNARWALADFADKFVRVVYTAVSGAGSVYSILNGKGI